MTVLTILLDSDAPARGRALAASLPVTVNLSVSAGELVLIDAGNGWIERLVARLAAGHRRFLVLDPVLPTTERLDRITALAKETAAQVAIAETHADNPAVGPFRTLLAGPYTIVTLVGHGPRTVADLLMQQVRLVRRTGFSSLSVVHAACNEDTALVTLRAERDGASTLIRLSVTSSRAGPPHHRLMAHAPTESACLEIGSEPIARPASACRIVESSETVLPTLYESAHRGVLRALANDEGGQRVDLPAWLEDAALVNALAAR